MKFVIMCGGFYEQWKTPKQLQIINGERIVERTIRLLRSNGVKDICISSNDERFDEFGVPRLKHENSYRYENGKLNGYWVDAFYPHFRKNQKVTFIYGDVYFSENAINTIVECNRKGNILIGSAGALRKDKVWGEPYAFIVNDMGAFYDGIEKTKRLQDAGKCNRVPITWELYRVLNGGDVNVHRVWDETYIAIDDETDDADTPEKLEKIKQRNEILGNVFTVINLNSIGGGESFLFYLVKKYAMRDLTIFYKQGDIRQIERLKRYARCIRYTGQKIRCKKAFFNYNQAFKDNIIADEYYQIIHCDYKARNLTPKATKDMKYIAVSETAKNSFTEHTGLNAELCYNPIGIESTERPLILMSATRLRKGKGKERIEKLARILDSEKIKYKWLIFTDDTNVIQNDNIIYLKPTLNVTDYMPLADWFIQLSDDEAYCYSVVEANLQGVPCIITPCPVFEELGVKGITVDFDLSNVDIETIKKPYKVEFNAPADRWVEILTDDKTNYEPPKETDLVHIRITKKYKDVILDRIVNSGEALTVTRKRLKELEEKDIQFQVICEV